MRRPPPNQGLQPTPLAQAASWQGWRPKGVGVRSAAVAASGRSQSGVGWAGSEGLAPSVAARLKPEAVRRLNPYCRCFSLGVVDDYTQLSVSHASVTQIRFR